MSFQEEGGQEEEEQRVTFLMPIEDISTKQGTGITVVTGVIERGILNVDEEVEIVGYRKTQKAVCTGVDKMGDKTSVKLRGIKREDVERGQVISKPGTIRLHTTFKSKVYMFTKEEGGRQTPFSKGYRPQFFIRTIDVTGTIELNAGVEMVKPGDKVDMEVCLVQPMAIENGTRFTIREGGRNIGSGVIVQLLA
mmetsp:Transcript_7436/g.10563  ORF Transcript_7436/g.10563 Transcript_7436/m.10563 type:complete len:194 (+) Transcript_7436:98-679(+)|eukprot:CAMPEP_0170065296 /NCGR_PEP_ID=MMETSP0019_2-20121128/5435_1 /TAXON_ID=98059 /ORGANISM="Dinobryon sp., Strain UTEXLB2267" /LENGTH=193 /DNA_ID=CAMNT_0010272127 /DNA_START=275 /DNA_END=852 /DNA_ORIENTATION=+